MKLHELKSKSKRKSQKRIGRGGKRGTFSGRGTKGQRSRAGRRIRKAERDLIIRLPKRRGFRNKAKSEKPLSIDAARLLMKLKPLLEGKKGVEVSLDTLRQVGLVSKRFSGRVKILGKGKIDSGIILKGIEASESVKTSIEKAGGRVDK